LANERDERLRKAEKAVRQGRIDAAIAEYTALVSEQANDLSALNALGDLLVRAGRSPEALPFYVRVADSYLREGFYSKAAGFYRKVLKFAPAEELPALRLAEALAAQGLLVEAKAQFASIATARRRHGDETGLEEVLVRICEIDPKDVAARLDLARFLVAKGDPRGPGLLETAAEQLRERGQAAEALAVVREIVAACPDNTARRAELVRAMLDAGDLEGAKGLLTHDAVGDDRVLMRQAAELTLRAGTPEEARQALVKWVNADPAGARDDVVDLCRSLPGLTTEQRFVAVDVAVDTSVATHDFVAAAGMLQDFISAHPGYVPALLRLLDVCVDGSIDGVLEAAQAQLALAYLGLDRLVEARLVAEDLLLRDPDDDPHRALLRRILEAQGEANPDEVIDALVELDGEEEVDLDAAVDVEEPPVAAPAFAPTRAVVEAVPATVAPAGPAEPPFVVPVHLVPDVLTVPAVTATAEVDLSGALEELDAGAAGAPGEVDEGDSEPAALEGVFDDMRARASTTRGVDGQQQVALGRTYLAAGLVDQAVGAFKRAAHDASVRTPASIALGEIFEEQQDYTHAIEWYERGADAASDAGGERLDAMRRLALALEAANESVRALAVWLEIQALHPEDREAPTRVARLSSPGAGR
jgi:tetratricopeptide (TPR) repeat protein